MVRIGLAEVYNFTDMIMQMQSRIHLLSSDRRDTLALNSYCLTPAARGDHTLCLRLLLTVPT